MKFSGIDLHSNNSVVTVIDEEDRVLAETRLPVGADAKLAQAARNHWPTR